MRLDGQVAIVTGGGRWESEETCGGIGKATCLAFAKEGADIVIPEVNLANAEAASAEITAQSVSAMSGEDDFLQASCDNKSILLYLLQFCKREKSAGNVG